MNTIDSMVSETESNWHDDNRLDSPSINVEYRRMVELSYLTTRIPTDAD